MTAVAGVSSDARIVVREANTNDAAALAALVRGIDEFTPEEVDVALELIESALARTDDYRLVVASEGSRNGVPRDASRDGRASSPIFGYACFGPTPMTNGAFDLYWIATAASHRGHGVGRAIVDAVLERIRAEKGRLLRVETSSRAEYASTRKFYDRAAFVRAATLVDFYDVGDDLVTYVRTV